MPYFWFKAFHIIGVVVWFAGLFYLVRLFIYHVEANHQSEPAQTILKQQYQLMEKRLYHLITTPGMVFTVTMAIALLITEPELLTQKWLQFKLIFVTALLAYHFYCGWLMGQLAAEKCHWSSQKLRILNEAPTVFLVTIVLLAVFKNALPVNTTISSLIALIIALLVIVQLYAKKRQKTTQNLTSFSTLERS